MGGDAQGSDREHAGIRSGDFPQFAVGDNGATRPDLRRSARREAGATDQLLVTRILRGGCGEDQTGDLFGFVDLDVVARTRQEVQLGAGEPPVQCSGHPLVEVRVGGAEDDADRPRERREPAALPAATEHGTR